MLHVAIVDDHKIVVDGIAGIINKSEEAMVIGKAYSMKECQQMLSAVQPDVLLLDIGLPDGDGIDLCSEIKANFPHIKILMLSSYGELATIKRALDANADGYVLKNSMPEELLEGIHTVASGQRFLCEEVDVTLQKNETNALELTRREKELLQLIVDGYTLPELADKMCLGYNTIRSYRKNLNIKLDAHNTAQLVQNAKALNLV